MLTRKQLEAQERKLLASYATKASVSKGRCYREPEHPYRTCFQRDHDRIIHSTAFRRLEYKTQVFVIHEGDYYRTRLTHSLEVTQIAETVARTLCLNTDLVKSIALAHDLGHGPFGHSGENALRKLMEGYGGFDHNLQALRVVDLLEQRNPTFAGLNLTLEVRDSLNKHRLSLPGTFKSVSKALRLEGQVVDLADEIAYDHHDLDDGLTSGLLAEEELRDVPLWRQVHQEVTRMFPHVRAEFRKYQIIRRLIDLQVTDLVRESSRRLKKYQIRKVTDVLNLPHRVIAFSPHFRQMRVPLKRFLDRKLYHHPKVTRMAQRAESSLTALFEAYLRNPEQLPRTTLKRLDHEEPHRVICDYIAGMTDHFAMEEYRKLSHPLERV